MALREEKKIIDLRIMATGIFGKEEFRSENLLDTPYPLLLQIRMLFINAVYPQNQVKDFSTPSLTSISVFRIRSHVPSHRRSQLDSSPLNA